MSKRGIKGSTAMYEMQAQICSALANPVRLHILDLLSSQEMTATELLEVLEIPKANLSQHIAVLKEVGIVSSRREGLYQYLSLGIPKIKEACSLVRNVLLEKVSREEKSRTRLLRELKAKNR